MYILHVRRTGPTSHMYGVHVRRSSMGVTSYCSGHALLFFVGVMADRPAMLAAVSIIIIRRRRRRREARVGREWWRDWLKERQSEKGMEEFVVTELAADLGEFPFPYTS